MSKKIINHIITLILIGAVVFVIFDFYDKSNSQKEFLESANNYETYDSEGEKLEYGAEKGNKIFDYELTDIKTGKTHNISDFEGKPVFLLFWASWCPYCTEFSKVLQEISLERDDIEIIGINVIDAESSKKDPIEFIDKLGLTYINAHPQEEMFDTFEANSIPTSVLINSEGVIVDGFVGGMTKEAITAKFDEVN